MSVFSNQLFISPERPIDPLTLSILELIDRLLRDAKIRYMLVGATARDLLLYHVFGHAVTRATYDLDFAILVDSWGQFAIVKQLFFNIPGFTDKGRNAQRLYYRPTGASFKTIIDIIPFGKLETAERTIAWPPDADVVMNVAAFSECIRELAARTGSPRPHHSCCFPNPDSLSSNSLLGSIGMRGSSWEKTRSA